MIDAWGYNSVTEAAAAEIAAIVEDAQGKFGDTALLSLCQAEGVVRLWRAIVGDAALEDDVARLRALCERLHAPPREPTGQLVFSLRQVK
jgi:hypothetical protein